MTVVEFFDNCSVENIASALLCAPDKVILVGDNEKRMIKSIEIYSQLTRERGIDVNFEYRKASRNNLMHNVQVLTEIVENEPGCVFDLEGGEDLFLTAVGIVFDKYSDKMQLHRFNIHTSSIVDCDADGEVCSTSDFDLSIEENVRIYGGSVVAYNGNSGTYKWDYDSEFIKDIELMWPVCAKNPARWNNRIACLCALCAESRSENDLDFEVSTEIIKTVMKKSGEYIDSFVSLLRSLEDCGAIINLIADENSISFSFKNSRIKRCLTTAGTLLELTVAVNALKATDKKGEKIYTDVLSGVCIDWDSVIEPEFSPDVANEIDVMAMKGLTPVFISCKNGSFNVNELYKLSVVAERFGGKYARKVLVASQPIGDNAKGRYLRARARDMGIRLIENFARMSREDTEKVFRVLWQAP